MGCLHAPFVDPIVRRQPETMRNMFLLLLLWAIYDTSWVRASSIQLSFLDNEDAVRSTMEFLLAKGCSQEAVNSFRRVIDWYNASATDLNLTGFPMRDGGFYSFDSISHLVALIPKPLIFTYHQNELNCFDTIILLAGDRMRINFKPDDISGPFLPPLTTTSNDVVLRVAATPRDAFAIICPSWWREGSKNIFSQGMQDKRICLTAAFDSFELCQAQQRGKI
jgi:hypothetical protein